MTMSVGGSLTVYIEAEIICTFIFLNYRASKVTAYNSNSVRQWIK